MLFSLLKHYLDTDTSLKVSQSVYCSTTSIPHGVENYFPRLWGTGISDAIFFELVILLVHYIQNLCTGINQVVWICLLQRELRLNKYNFFLFLRLKILFGGSLHSRPLHGLELVSFSTIPGWCNHGNTFLFLGLINIFMGSLHSLPWHGLELISFSAIPGNKCCHDSTFLCFLDL